MKMGVKEMKKEFKHINIDQIEDLQVEGEAERDPVECFGSNKMRID